MRASVIYVSADRISPGIVRSKSNARVVLDGSPQIVQHLKPVQEALNNSFVTVVLSEDIELVCGENIYSLAVLVQSIHLQKSLLKSIKGSKCKSTLDWIYERNYIDCSIRKCSAI